MRNRGEQARFDESYEELLGRYAERFREAFPVFLAPSDLREQMRLMEEALASGKAYDPYRDPSFDPDADY